MSRNSIERRGIDHVQFTCSDMERTIAFWEAVGMRIRFNLQLHEPERYHFFIDVGRDNLISYWYFPGKTLKPAASHEVRDHAGFYHLAFHVESEEELMEMAKKLKARGIEVSEMTGRHLFDKSVYFLDPDGIQFEFSCRMFELEGTIDHDGNGRLTPVSKGAKLQNRTLDGPVQFETRFK